MADPRLPADVRMKFERRRKRLGPPRIDDQRQGAQQCPDHPVMRRDECGCKWGLCPR